MNILIHKDSPLPTNRPEDAGHDIIAVSEPKIVGDKEGGDVWRRIDYIEYDTGVIVAPEEGAYLHVYPRSSISKTNLILANSVATIDNGYRATIKLRFRYILQPSDLVIINGLSGPFIYGSIDYGRVYQKGDKIGQLISARKEDIKWLPAELLPASERDKGGFGSTGA